MMGGRELRELRGLRGLRELRELSHKMAISNDAVM
jgi:hypothetical protein